LEIVKKIYEFERQQHEVLYSAISDENLSLSITNTEKARSDYLSRLMEMGLLSKSPSNKQQSYFIFDWDDTLLPTTFIQQQGFPNMNPDVLKHLEPIDDSSSKILEKAWNLGEVFIVTNAFEGWIELSSGLYMPKTIQIIKEKRIKLLSARAKYERRYPKDPHRWKKEAFLETI